MKPLQQTRPKTTNIACTGPERVRTKPGVETVGKQRGDGKVVVIRGKQGRAVSLCGGEQLGLKMDRVHTAAPLGTHSELEPQVPAP